jgi:hypothetical protein
MPAKLINGVDDLLGSIRLDVDVRSAPARDPCKELEVAIAGVRGTIGARSGISKTRVKVPDSVDHSVAGS